jgi:hypothetical protein
MSCIDLSLLQSFRRLQLPTEPPLRWVLGVVSLEEKKLRCKADCLPQSNVEVKYNWSCIFAPLLMSSLPGQGELPLID